MIGRGRHDLPRRFPAHHEKGMESVIHAETDIRMQAIPHHDDFIPRERKLTENTVAHVGKGFAADDVGFPSARHLQKCDKGAHVGGKYLFGRAHVVGVRRDIGRPLDEIAIDLFELFISERGVVGEHADVGGLFRQADSVLPKILL